MFTSEVAGLCGVRPGFGMSVRVCLMLLSRVSVFRIVADSSELSVMVCGQRRGCHWDVVPVGNVGVVACVWIVLEW